MHVVLMGLRASGKSTLGRALADVLRRFFVDLDDVTAIELDVKSPAEGLQKFGEPAFRAAEVRALAKVLGRNDRVIALGGGTPTAPGAREMLAKEQDAGKALLVYLRASAETLRARLDATDLSTRPALLGSDPLLEIEALLERRDAAYVALADETIEVDDLTSEDVLARLLVVARAAERDRA
jgi:shikimate kinase